MDSFDVVVKNVAGKVVSINVQAKNEPDAVAKCEALGMSVIEISRHKEASRLKISGKRFFTRLPAVKFPKLGSKGVVFMAVLVMIAIFSGRSGNGFQNESCRDGGSLACMAEKYAGVAGRRCDDRIESMAKYDFRWTDGIFSGKFSRYRWFDRKSKIIVYLGDQVEFQNGFGVWQRHHYVCVFDTGSGVVLDVNVSPGRLGMP